MDGLIVYLLTADDGRKPQRFKYTATASTNPDESSMDRFAASRSSRAVSHPATGDETLSAYAAANRTIAAKAGDSQPRALIRRSILPCRIQRPGVGRVDRPPPRFLLPLLVCLVLAYCTKPQFNNIDITGVDYARDFTLTDASGVRRTLSDYRGKVVVLFFGYTHCPDVCPTTLSQLAQARRLLGADADRVQVLFATLDPQRDAPALLTRYVQAFDPSFVGLTGTPDEIAGAAREFKVFFQKVDGPTADSYTLDHASGSFVFDPQGHVRLYVLDRAQAAQIAPDLRRLLG